MTPDTFFPLTDYQKISGAVNFDKATVCFELPPSYYLSTDNTLLNQMGLWYLDNDGYWKVGANFVNNSNTYTACMNFYSYFNGDGQWFGIGSQICPVFPSNADVTVDSLESEYTFSMSYSFESSTASNLLVTDPTNCHALKIVPSISPSYSLRFTYYAQPDEISGCDFDRGAETNSLNDVLSSEIKVDSTGVNLKENVGLINFDVYENYLYSGSELSESISYQLRLQSFARSWISCSDQTVTVCQVTNVSCDPLSQTPTKKLTECETKTFTTPYSGEITIDQWNCTEGTETCKKTECLSVGVDTLNPNGTCQTIIYQHMIAEVYSVSGAFVAKSDTWRTLKDPSSSLIIDFPLTSFQVDNLQIFPQPPVKKRNHITPRICSSPYSNFCQASSSLVTNDPLNIGCKCTYSGSLYYYYPSATCYRDSSRTQLGTVK